MHMTLSPPIHLHFLLEREAYEYTQEIQTYFCYPSWILLTWLSRYHDNLHGWARKSLHSIIKNSQILPNQAETQAILLTHELIIFTKFDNDWVKIKDF